MLLASGTAFDAVQFTYLGAQFQPLGTTPQVGLRLECFKFINQFLPQFVAAKEKPHLVVIQAGAVVQVGGAHKSPAVSEKELGVQFAVGYIATPSGV